jgi:hypothetical protein
MFTTNAFLRAGLAATTGLVLAGMSMSPAAADPTGSPRSTVIHLTCGGEEFQAVVNGEGAWSPALDLGSNAVLIPVSFGEAHFTLTDAGGGVLEEGTDPPRSKGASQNADLDCTYTGSGTFEDPELGLVTFTFSGDVSGFKTPRG